MTGTPGPTSGPAAAPPYPVRVDARLDRPLSRWLWLVKWLLLIPHWFVLAFLWIAFVAVSVIAFFAILITGRYPRALFDFNVGVLRWSWRVHYYGYAALGTDRYPPFTLADVPDYPAHLDVPYPERLSRGLVLVKWWLLAIPHYIVLAVLFGGGIWLSTRPQTTGAWSDGWAAGGLVGILVLIAAVILLVTGRYPVGLYDFVLGMDRWALRVAAYVALMTDRYPPFRLDPGGSDPGWVSVGWSPIAPAGGAIATPAYAADPPVWTPPAPAGAEPGSSARPGGWTAGRVLALIAGALLLFVSTGLLVGGAGLLWADRTQREGQFLWTSTSTVSTAGYAVTADQLTIEGSGADWALDSVIGTAQLQARPVSTDSELFVGIASAADAASYLRGVQYSRLDTLGEGSVDPGTVTVQRGGAPEVAPGAVDIWVAQSSGPGTQTLRWQPTRGTWTVVLMRADGTAGVAAHVRAGATVPAAPWIGVGLLALGAVLAGLGGLVIALAAHRATTPPPAPSGAPPVLPAPRGPMAPMPDEGVGRGFPPASGTTDAT